MKGDLLKGIKIIDFTTYAAAPCSARIMADWGADVIKVEGFSGDPMRKFGANMADTPYTDEENPCWEYENGNKRAIVLDLKNPKGMEVMHKLLSEADGFVSNVRLGSLEKMGLTYEALHEKYPKLVVGHISGYGLYGEDAPRPGYDTVSFWARGGSMLSLAPKGHPPITSPYGIGDHTTGLVLCAGVMGGIVKAQRTGIGEKIVVSLFGTAVWTNALMVMGSQYGYYSPQSRYQPGNPLTSTYMCKDEKWITLTVLDFARYWKPFCEIFGMPEWAEDPDYCTIAAVTSDPERLEGCVKKIEEQFLLNDRDYWAEKLVAADIAFEKALLWDDVATDKQAIDNKFVKEFTMKTGRTFMLPMTPVQFQGNEGLDSNPAPLLGENTEEILKELGYSDEDIAAMIAEKAVKQYGK